MSGLNGTGPIGKGPMSGGGRGMCKLRDNSKKAAAAGFQPGKKPGAWLWSAKFVSGHKVSRLGAI